MKHLLLMKRKLYSDTENEAMNWHKKYKYNLLYIFVKY